MENKRVLNFLNIIADAVKYGRQDCLDSESETARLLYLLWELSDAQTRLFRPIGIGVKNIKDRHYEESHSEKTIREIRSGTMA